MQKRMSHEQDESNRSAPSGAGKNRSLDRETTQLIGNRLKNMYEGIVSEAVPDRFLSLLDELDKAEKKRGI